MSVKKLLVIFTNYLFFLILYLMETQENMHQASPNYFNNKQRQTLVSWAQIRSVSDGNEFTVPTSAFRILVTGDVRTFINYYNQHLVEYWGKLSEHGPYSCGPDASLDMLPDLFVSDNTPGIFFFDLSKYFKEEGVRKNPEFASGFLTAVSNYAPSQAGIICAAVGYERNTPPELRRRGRFDAMFLRSDTTWVL